MSKMNLVDTESAKKAPSSARGARAKKPSYTRPSTTPTATECERDESLSASESSRIWCESGLSEALERLIQHHPVLTPSQETSLLDSQIPDAEKRELLWKHNLRFAVMLSNEAYKRRHAACIVTHYELSCEAVKTLWDASLKFEAAQGVRFLSYARWHVKRGLADTLRRSASGVTLPTQFLLKLSRARSEDKQAEEGDIRSLFAGVTSFDAPKSTDGFTDLHGIIAEDDTRIGCNDTPENLETLLDLIDRFNARTSVLLRSFYGIGTPRLSGEELATKYGVSRQAINTSIKKGLKRLRLIVATKGYKLSDFV